MPPIAVFFLFCHITYNIHANQVIDANNRHLLDFMPPGPENIAKAKTDEKKSQDSKVVINLNSNANAPLKEPIAIEALPPDSKKNKSTTPTPNKNETKDGEYKIFKSTEMESGALLRGVAVVVVLTMLVLTYMGLKTYCSKKGKNPVVSKYGVRTRRSDLEMTPLPLDDDEDDETLFEVNR